MENEIYAARDAITALKAEQKTLQSTLSHLNSTPTTDALLYSVKCLEDEKLELDDRIASFRSETKVVISAEEREKVDKTYNELSRRVIARKKIFVTFWTMMVDSLPEGQNGVELWVRTGSILIYWQVERILISPRSNSVSRMKDRPSLCW
jgi:hypothetical protein